MIGSPSRWISNSVISITLSFLEFYMEMQFEEIYIEVSYKTTEKY